MTESCFRFGLRLPMDTRLRGYDKLPDGSWRYDVQCPAKMSRNSQNVDYEVEVFDRMNIGVIEVCRGGQTPDKKVLFRLGIKK